MHHPRRIIDVAAAPTLARSGLVHGVVHRVRGRRHGLIVRTPALVDDEAVSELPTRDAVHVELERARKEFGKLIEQSSAADLARPSSGTRWTNRELLFHMLFGYLITRNLRYVVKVMARAPRRVQNGFAAALDSSTRPFDWINYWGARLGAVIVSPTRMIRWADRVIGSLNRTLDTQTEAALQRGMVFPTRWDPHFKSRMTMLDVYHYATMHFEHHRRQLTLADRREPT